MNAQKIETVKTNTKMNDGGNLQLSYSYYVGDNGQKVLHGAFSAKATDNNPDDGETGTVSVSCTYKDGVIDGKFSYSKHTKGFVGEKVMAPNGVIGLRVVPKPGLDVNEDISFEVYHGRMTGVLNFSTEVIGTRREFHGTVINGIIKDGEDFIFICGGDKEFIKNFKPSNTPNANLVSVSRFDSSIPFYVTYMDMSLTPYVKVPLYVGMNLEDIPDYQEALTLKDTEETDKYLYLLSSIRSTYRNKLPEGEIERLKLMETECKEKIKTQEELAKKKTAEEQKQYSKLYGTYSSLEHKGITMVHEPIERGNQYVRDRNAELGFIPVLFDLHVENLITVKYNKMIKTVWASHASKVNFDSYGEIIDTNTHAPYSKSIEDISKEFDKFSWISTLESTRVLCYSIKAQAVKIELFYTKTTPKVSSVENIRRETCEKKIVKKKDIYLAYCAIAEQYDMGMSDSVSLEEYSANISAFAQISQKVFESIDKDTKDLEKSLKKAGSIEEKIKILTQP